MSRSLFVLLLCLLPVWATAQDQGQRKSDRDRRTEREAIQAQKVAFITQEVGLTSEEAEKFWPLYNEMDRKLNELGHKRGRTKAEIFHVLNPSFGTTGRGTAPAGSSEGRTAAGDHRASAEQARVDAKPKGPAAPIDALLETFINTFTEENDLRMEYHRKFLKVLTAAQIARLYLAEEHFSNKLFRDYIDRKLDERSKPSRP